MNRIIKFRAWNKEIKSMGSAFPIDVIAADIAERPAAFYKDWKNLELMQFTGLKDDSGKEIYEGDIVLASNIDRRYAGGDIDRCIIKYDETDAMFKVNDYGTMLGAWASLKVVGNIYENPELLK